MSNYLTNEERLLRERRARIVYLISSILFIALSFYLIWALRELILPAVIGMVMSYICLPILGRLKDKGFFPFLGGYLPFRAFLPDPIFSYQYRRQPYPRPEDRARAAGKNPLQTG